MSEDSIKEELSKKITSEPAVENNVVDNAFIDQDKGTEDANTVPLDMENDLPLLEATGLEGLMGNVNTELITDLPPLGESEQSKEDLERERMKLLVSHFDEQQMARYAAFRRANIRRAAVRKYASQLLNQPISNNVAVVLAGMSKVLIGDIIELARDLQEKEQSTERRQLGLPDPAPGAEPEPLLPSFIRQAWRIHKEQTQTVPGSKTKPGSGNRFF